MLRDALADATGTTRIRFTPEQGRRLAIKAKALTPKERDESCQIIRPATILAWFPRLGTRAYVDSASRRAPGRPRKAKDVQALVVRMARENLGWGYTKISRCPSWPSRRDRAHNPGGHTLGSGPRAGT